MMHTYSNISRNRQSTFSPLSPFLPLPKYFESEWSYAQYRIPVQSSHISLSSTSRLSNADLPDEERCVVGWMQGPPQDALQPTGVRAPNYQLLALTFTGGWYRLALPKHKNTGSPTLCLSPSPGSPPKSSSSQRAPRSVSGSSTTSRVDKGKEKECDKEKKESSNCTLQEYLRYGRWDGWG